MHSNPEDVENIMATVGGSFAVGGSTYREVTLDTKGLTVEQIAAKLENEASNPSFCHECSGECQDSFLDGLTSLTVDGVEYVADDSGKWTAYQPK